MFKFLKNNVSFTKCKTVKREEVRQDYYICHSEKSNRTYSESYRHKMLNTFLRIFQHDNICHTEISMGMRLPTNSEAQEVSSLELWGKMGFWTDVTDGAGAAEYVDFVDGNVIHGVRRDRSDIGVFCVKK